MFAKLKSLEIYKEQFTISFEIKYAVVKHK